MDFRFDAKVQRKDASPPRLPSPSPTPSQTDTPSLHGDAPAAGRTVPSPNPPTQAFEHEPEPVHDAALLGDRVMLAQPETGRKWVQPSLNRTDSLTSTDREGEDESSTSSSTGGARPSTAGLAAEWRTGYLASHQYGRPPQDATLSGLRRDAFARPGNISLPTSPTESHTETLSTVPTSTAELDVKAAPQNQHIEAAVSGLAAEVASAPPVGFEPPDPYEALLAVAGGGLLDLQNPLLKSKKDQEARRLAQHDVPGDVLKTAQEIVKGQVDPATGPNRSLREMKDIPDVSAVELKHADFEVEMDIADRVMPIMMFEGESDG